MIPKLITFDCAHTLVDVPKNWTLGGFASDCARQMGLDVNDQHAKAYNKLYMQGLPEFWRLNQSRNEDEIKAYWRRLASTWFDETGLPQGRLDEMLATADELGFGPNSILFRVYEDVIPCLDRLDAMGIRAAVISNWDHSLPRVLSMFGIFDRFVTVKASLQEGVEKPDPRLFEITLRAAGFDAGETLHIGDQVGDDLEGAKSAGIRALLIDRFNPDVQPPTLRTLANLPEAFAWID